MIINKSLVRQVGKRYARRAATYRRAMGKRCGMDFSLQALIECKTYESLGVGTVSRLNGYYAGKRFMDVTIKDAISEVTSGNFAKIEFYTPIGRWYWEPILKNI